MNANTVPLQHHQWQLAADPAQAAAEPAAPPLLRVAPRPSLRRRGLRITPLTGAMIAVAVILATISAQLGLSIAVSRGAYEAQALQRELRDLNRVERVLARNVEQLASPQNLAEQAAQLGMVQNTTPATLRLSDATILGLVEAPVAETSASLVPNATLSELSQVDVQGLQPEERQPEQIPAAAADSPTSWEGLLPAPQTH